jgi:hypothetical protein
MPFSVDIASVPKNKCDWLLCTMLPDKKIAPLVVRSHCFMRFHFAWILEKKPRSLNSKTSDGKLKGGGNKKASSVKAQKETKKPKKEKETKEDQGWAQKSVLFCRGWGKRGGHDMCRCIMDHLLHSRQLQSRKSPPFKKS